MDVNFFAGVRITKALLPLLMDSKGRVVNVTSTCGFWANPQVMPP
jgi:short-subunit dehydrogenase